MSYLVEITIACDAEECRERLRLQRINEGGLSKTWAGAIAAEQGWWVAGKPGSHDPKSARCPKHRKADR